MRRFQRIVLAVGVLAFTAGGVTAGELKTVTQGTRVLGEGQFFTTVRAPVLLENRPARQCLPDGPCYTVHFRHEPAAHGKPERFDWTVRLANPNKRMVSVRWSCHRHQEGYQGPTFRYAANEWRRYSPGRDPRPGVVCSYVEPDFVPEWIEIGLEWSDRR